MLINLVRKKNLQISSDDHKFRSLFILLLPFIYQNAASDTQIYLVVKDDPAIHLKDCSYTKSMEENGINHGNPIATLTNILLNSSSSNVPSESESYDFHTFV